MIFLTSCKDKIICKEIKSYAIKPLVLYDVSFQFNRCRARCFNANKWITLPINSCPELSAYASDYPETFQITKDGETVNLPLEQCEGVSGFYLNDMATELRPKIKSLDSLKTENCGE